METVNGSNILFKIEYGTPGLYATPWKIIGPGVMNQVKYVEARPREVGTFTTRMLDEYLNELSMSKRYYNKKKKISTQMTDEQIKAVMDLYKPNFIQKLYMKYFSNIETTNVARNSALVLVAGLVALGFIFNSPAELIVGLSIGSVVIAGNIYSTLTNKKRIAQIMSVLSLTEDEVKALEVKYYLS
jgi:hypothetical protein